MNPRSSPSTTAEVDAVRLLLERIGVRPEQLLGLPSSCTTIPTFGEYIDRVSEAVSSGTQWVYSSYWARVLDVWSDRPGL